MPTPFRTLGLAAVLLLVAPGCDSLTSSNLLDGPSSSERAALAGLTGDYFECDAEIQTLTDNVTGALEDGDCLQTDGSYQDFYTFRLGEPAEVEIEMESEDVAPYLFLLSADLDADDPLVEVARDRNASETGRASIRATLPSGLYLVYANSVLEGETGEYTVTVEANRDDSRPAARPAPAPEPAGTR